MFLSGKLNSVQLDNKNNFFGSNCLGLTLSFFYRIILFKVLSRRFNAEYTDLCAPVEIDRIEWANRMAPNEGLLKFHQAADTDGFVPDMSANTKITDIYLQIKVISRRPANAVFEFSCQYNSMTSR